MICPPGDKQTPKGLQRLEIPVAATPERVTTARSGGPAVPLPLHKVCALSTQQLQGSGCWIFQVGTASPSPEINLLGGRPGIPQIIPFGDSGRGFPIPASVQDLQGSGLLLSPPLNKGQTHRHRQGHLIGFQKIPAYLLATKPLLPAVDLPFKPGGG